MSGLISLIRGARIGFPLFKLCGLATLKSIETHVATTKGHHGKSHNRRVYDHRHARGFAKSDGFLH